MSKYKGAILGVDNETKLVGIFGEKEMITPVSIDEAASSNSKLSVPCKNYFHTYYISSLKHQNTLILFYKQHL